MSQEGNQTAGENAMQEHTLEIGLEDKQTEEVQAEKSSAWSGFIPLWSL